MRKKSYKNKILYSLGFKISVSLVKKNCFKMNVILTFQYKLLQLCPLINIVYNLPRYFTFVGNAPINIRGSLVKGLYLLITFLCFLIKTIKDTHFKGVV